MTANPEPQANRFGMFFWRKWSGKKPTKTVQMFDNRKTTNTKGFLNWLETDMLKGMAIKAKRRTTSAEISLDEPLLVMCPRNLRITFDIEAATRDLKVSGIPDNLVAVILIHTVALHAIPTQKTINTLQNKDFKKYGLLVEFAYLDGTFHECTLNTDGKKELKQFLAKHAKPCTAPASVGTQTDRVSEGKNMIQFYTQPGANDQPLLKHIEGSSIKVVQSIAALQPKNMWIIVEQAGCTDIQHLRSGVANITILVLLDKDIQEKYSKSETINPDLLQIELGYEVQGPQIEQIRNDVIGFINHSIQNDVSTIFEEGGNGRIEVFIDTEDGYLDMFLGNARRRVVKSLPHFSKQDPRVLWLIMCENNTPLNFDQVYQANAKVIIVLDDEDSAESYTKDDSLVDSRFLLKIRARKSCLSTQSDDIKHEIVAFMINVQKKLMLYPVEKLLNPDTFFNWLRQGVQYLDPYSHYYY